MRITIIVALLALLVAACSSEETPSPSPTAAASQPATPEPPATDTASPSAQPDGSGVAIPSFGFDLNGDPELAGRLPGSVGGQPLQVFSMRGDDAFAGAGSADPAFEELFDSVGADTEDISVAFGGTPDGSVGILAFRVAGVPEDTLEQEFLDANEAQGQIANVEQRSIGGKDVWTATSTDPDSPGTSYIYVRDDTVYFLTGTEGQAAEILEALP